MKQRNPVRRPISALNRTQRHPFSLSCIKESGVSGPGRQKTAFIQTNMIGSHRNSSAQLISGCRVHRNVIVQICRDPCFQTTCKYIPQKKWKQKNRKAGQYSGNNDEKRTKRPLESSQSYTRLQNSFLRGTAPDHTEKWTFLAMKIPG